MKTTTLSQRLISITVITTLLFPWSASLFPARAAALTETLMRLDTMRNSQTDVQILVVVKPASTATEASIRINFATGYGVDATPANITTSTTGLPTTVQGESLTAWPSIGGTSSGVSGQQVDFNSGDLTAGTLYGFYITAGIDTPGSVGQYINTLTTRTSAPADIDTSKVATRIIANDQVVITATVPPTFSFTLGANTTSFATDLDTSAVNSATGVTVTVGTNASKGWVAWLKSANAALTSVAASQSIATSGTIDGSCTTVSIAGGHTDYYQLDVDSTTDGPNGTGTAPVIAAEYNCAADSGGTFSTTFQEIATGDGTTDGDVVTMIARVSPSAIRAAATDYTDTWTVVGAANF